jgi:guanine deaminase
MPAAQSAADETHLRHALRLAGQHMQAGHGGPFGALVVRDDRVIGQGWNQVTTSNDPTAHAEVVAIRAACRTLGDFRLTGATLYTSCEPCPMCLAAAWWARVGRIVFAATRADAADAGFDDADLYDEIARPLPGRHLPILQALPADGRAVLAAWTTFPGRIPY